MKSDDDILSIVAPELSLSATSQYSGQNGDLETSLAYYLGNPNGKEVEGRSSVTSTDVADAIEWIMPQIMKSFTQTNEVVIFDPVHNEDEKQAELESEYVYEVLMKQNDGFVTIHQFVKDALMQRNGIIKVYYEDDVTESTVDYTGVTIQDMQALQFNEYAEIIEQTEYVMDDGMGQLIPCFDIKVKYVHTKGRILVEAVPPEEFRINAQHNSIVLEDARFTAHVVLKSQSELIEMGIDPDVVDDLPEGFNYHNREYRHRQQGESTYLDRVDSGDDSERIIEISECYMRMDVNEDGVSELVKITVAGGDSPSHLLSVEEVSSMPWVATTAILMSHKFQGLSITDRLMEIQDQKTALWRNMFDNLYLQNNQRNLVMEGQVNMDDLLVSRPGGIVRAKRPDAVVPLVTPQVGPEAMNMMAYLDEVRAGRVGVSAEGAATPQNIGDRVGSEGVERLMNAKEELVGLIIRVIAETGLKPLCCKIRDLSTQHMDAVEDFKFRGQWVKIQPTQWFDRTKTTVRVGTGTGNHAQQVAALNQVMMLQAQVKQDPATALLTEQKVFDSLDDYCKFSGLNSANKYFLDPSSQEGQAARQAKDQQMQQESQKMQEQEMAMMQMQNKLADAEVQKAEANMQNVNLTAQNNMQKNKMQQDKQEFDALITSLKLQLEEANAEVDDVKHQGDLEHKFYQTDTTAALELTRIEKDSEKEENDNFKGNRDTIQ